MKSNKYLWAYHAKRESKRRRMMVARYSRLPLWVLMAYYADDPDPDIRGVVAERERQLPPLVVRTQPDGRPAQEIVGRTAVKWDGDPDTVPSWVATPSEAERCAWATGPDIHTRWGSSLVHIPRRGLLDPDLWRDGKFVLGAKPSLPGGTIYPLGHGLRAWYGAPNPIASQQWPKAALIV